MTLHRPHGTLSTADDVISLTPEDAGWTYTGLRVLRIEAGGSRTVETGEFRPLTHGSRVTAQQPERVGAVDILGRR